MVRERYCAPVLLSLTSPGSWRAAVGVLPRSYGPRRSSWNPTVKSLCASGRSEPTKRSSSRCPETYLRATYSNAENPVPSGRAGEVRQRPTVTGKRSGQENPGDKKERAMTELPHVDSFDPED